jgi:hypothetical protein
MVVLVERMLALRKALQAADTDSGDLSFQIAETDAEIDALVYKLYDLTADEIAIIEGKTD